MQALFRRNRKLFQKKVQHFSLSEDIKTVSQLPFSGKVSLFYIFLNSDTQFVRQRHPGQDILYRNPDISPLCLTKSRGNAIIRSQMDYSYICI